MQRVLIKKVLFGTIFSWFGLLSGYSQSYQQQLQQADSLFAAQSYAPALYTYETVMQRSGQTSPAMLLKMAYLAEESNNYTKALYYLSVFYTYRPNQSVTERMRELAIQHNLWGYEFRDVDFFMVLYKRYYRVLVMVLLFISLIAFASLLFRKLRREYIPLRHILGYLIFLCTVFVLLNLPKNRQRAIIAHDYVYLMSAPSAGGQLLSVLPKGNRLEIQDEQDIWLQVSWNEQTAYVRRQHVLLVNN